MWRQPKAVWAVAFASVVAFMGIGLVDPILKPIADNLNASPSQVSLLFTSYMAVMGVAMLITGYSWQLKAPTLFGGVGLVFAFGASALGLDGEATVEHWLGLASNQPWGLPVAHYHEDVPEGMKWLLEHLPYYDKWYRFWLFWMSTEGFLPMVKADEGWNGPPTAVGSSSSS